MLSRKQAFFVLSRNEALMQAFREIDGKAGSLGLAGENLSRVEKGPASISEYLGFVRGI